LGFVVDKVALGQVFLRGFWLPPVIIIPPWLSIWDMSNTTVGGRSSEITLSYLIGMNKTQMMNALSGPLEGF
jgi:hypothetical protein